MPPRSLRGQHRPQAACRRTSVTHPASGRRRPLRSLSPVTPLGRSRPTLPQQATRRRRVATPSCVRLASRPAPLPHPPAELTPALHLSVSLRGDCLRSPLLPPTANRHDCRLRPAPSPRGTTRHSQRIASAPNTPPQRVRTAPGFLRLHRPADTETHPSARLRFSDVQHGSAFSAWFSAVQDRVVPTPSSTPQSGPPSGHTSGTPVTPAATDTEQRPFFPRRSVSSSAPHRNSRCSYSPRPRQRHR